MIRKKPGWITSSTESLLSCFIIYTYNYRLIVSFFISRANANERSRRRKETQRTEIKVFFWFGLVWFLIVFIFPFDFSVLIVPLSFYCSVIFPFRLNDTHEWNGFEFQLWYIGPGMQRNRNNLANVWITDIFWIFINLACDCTM